MFKTATLARQKGVAIGAHPGFDDLWGFGRRQIRGHTMDELERMVAYQIGALQALATMAGHKVTHVKSHGALGNMVNDEEEIAVAFGRAIKAVDPSLVYVVMPGLPSERAAEKLGLPLVKEFFADRNYDDSGNLRSRKMPDAMIHDAEEAATRILRVLDDRAVTSVSGKRIPVEIETICVHGDGPTAVAMARAVRAKLEANGVAVMPFCAVG
jgi:UPF0271 protein